MRSGSKAAFWSRISVIASVAKQSRAAYARSGLPRAFGPRNDDIKSGLADRDVAGRFGLRGLDLLREQAVEIDRFEQQRREAAILHGIGDDAACEGEEDARRFGEEEGLQLVVGDVADAEQAGIFKVDDEDRARRMGRAPVGTPYPKET